MPKEKNPLDDCTLVWIWEHHPCLVSFFLSWTCSLTTSHTGQHLPIQQPRDRPGGAVFVWLCPLPSSKCFILFACWHLYSLLVKRWNENEEEGGKLKQMTNQRGLFTDHCSLQRAEELRAASPDHGWGSVGGVLFQPAAFQPWRQHGGGADAVHQQRLFWHQEPAHRGCEAPVWDEGQGVPRDRCVRLSTVYMHGHMKYNPAGSAWKLHCSLHQIKQTYLLQMSGFFLLQ